MKPRYSFIACTVFFFTVSLFYPLSKTIGSPLVKHHGKGMTYSAFQSDDPYLFQQQYLGHVHAQEGWDMVTKYVQQRDVVIAVLDTGVDSDHPDLRNSMWINTDEIPGDGIDNDGNSYIDDVRGWDFITSTNDPRPKLTDAYTYEAVHHGTVVSGIIAAQTNNGIGIAGGSLYAKIMPLRVLDSLGAGSTLLLAQAIDYAVENGANIINLSLVGEVRDDVLQDSIDRAYRAGVAIVAASGNETEGGINLDVAPRYPVCESGSLNKIIGVASVDELGKLSPFSNYGSRCIDISAPGTNMFSTVWHLDSNASFVEYYKGGWSGTSVAAPLVSSALALIKEIAPNLSLPEVYRIMLDSASSVRSANVNYRDLGAGLVNFESAVRLAYEVSRQNPIRIVLGSGVGHTPMVRIVDKNGSVVSEFSAYTMSFTGGVRVVTGDVDGDGEFEIITAPASRGGPHIRIFDMQGRLKGQFMAYHPQFRGGVNVAIGDVNGDGVGEIVTAPLVNGGPHVRVFSAKGALLNQFMAYAPSFYGGVNIATGDIDRDRVDEIVTAPASRGGPHVRIFSREGYLKGQFMAFDQSFRGGLTIDVGDVDGIEGAEIVAAQLVDSNVQVRIFNEAAQEKNRFLVFQDPGMKEQQMYLLIVDYTGDRFDDILLYPHSMGATLLQFDYFGRMFDMIDLSSVQSGSSQSQYFFAILR